MTGQRGRIQSRAARKDAPTVKRGRVLVPRLIGQTATLPADSARAAMVPDGDVHRAQNAQFRMMLLRGFRLEWLCGREENRTEQVGRSARCGLAGVWVLQDPSICGPARRVRQG
jgi:hypothetical protein